jgi:hypothetical protein
MGFGSGLVHVLYGSAVGLTATGSQLWSQDSPGVAGAPEFLDFFGQTLAASLPSGTGETTGDGVAAGAEPSRPPPQPTTLSGTGTDLRVPVAASQP